MSHWSCVTIDMRDLAQQLVSDDVYPRDLRFIEDRLMTHNARNRTGDNDSSKSPDQIISWLMARK